MRRDAWGLAALCVLPLAGALLAPGALADQAAPGGQAALHRTSPGGDTITLPRSAPGGPAPGGFTLLNPEEVRTAARDAALRPPPCSGRSHAGREIGSLIGGIAGLAAVIALLDDDDHDSRNDQRATQAAGAIIGSTAGYLAGSLYDGPDSCGTPRLPERLPVIFLSDDQMERLDHRRQTPGQATLLPREPGR